MTVDNSNADGMEAAPIVGDERSMPNSNICHRMKLLPIGILSVESLQGQITKRPFRVLFDSGSMLTLINSRVSSRGRSSRVSSSHLPLHRGWHGRVTTWGMFAHLAVSGVIAYAKLREDRGGSSLSSHTELCYHTWH
jgi:hypothetical protein